MHWTFKSASTSRTDSKQIASLFFIGRQLSLSVDSSLNDFSFRLFIREQTEEEEEDDEDEKGTEKTMQNNK